MFRILFAASAIVSTLVVVLEATRPVESVVYRPMAPARPAEAVAYGPMVSSPGLIPPAGLPASFAISYTGPDGTFATTAYYAGNPFIGTHERDTTRHQWISGPVSYTAIGTIDCPGLLPNGLPAPPYTGPLPLRGNVVITLSGSTWYAEIDPHHDYRFATSPTKQTGATGNITGTRQFGVGLVTIN